MKCRNCGHKCSEKNTICPNCGAEFEEMNDAQRISLILAEGGIVISLLALFLPIVIKSVQYTFIPKVNFYRALMSGPQLEGVLLFPLLIAFGVLMLMKKKPVSWACYVMGGVLIILDVLALTRLYNEVEENLSSLGPVTVSMGVGFYMLLAGGVLFITAGVIRQIMHR